MRTATPVYGTTHHVLKRIAVPNDNMLTEVKKEVDIMVRTNPLARQIASGANLVLLAYSEF